MYKDEDGIVLGLLAFLAIVLCIVGFFIYDMSTLTPISYNNVLIVDKYHENGSCYSDGATATYCDSDTYGLIIETPDGDIEQKLNDNQWKNLRVGSKVNYSFQQGRLGTHYHVEIAPVYRAPGL